VNPSPQLSPHLPESQIGGRGTVAPAAGSSSEAAAVGGTEGVLLQISATGFGTAFPTDMCFSPEVQAEEEGEGEGWGGTGAEGVVNVDENRAERGWRMRERRGLRSMRERRGVGTNQLSVSQLSLSQHTLSLVNPHMPAPHVKSAAKGSVISLQVAGGAFGNPPPLHTHTHSHGVEGSRGMTSVETDDAGRDEFEHVQQDSGAFTRILSAYSESHGPATLSRCGRSSVCLLS
jgi:hypothetical protein